MVMPKFEETKKEDKKKKSSKKKKNVKATIDFTDLFGDRFFFTLL